VREVIFVEEASYPVYERLSLQVRECTEEVRTPGRSPVAATELRDFRSGLLLKPKGRELSSGWTFLVTVKVYTRGVG
jgi:hypothetical protein